MTVNELIVRLQCARDAGAGNQPVLLGGPDEPLVELSRIAFVSDAIPGVRADEWQDGVLLR